MVNRQEFISQLGKEAENLGVQIQTDNKIRSINNLDGNYIVDASGCPSIIKREFKIDYGIRGIGYQQTLEKSNYFENDTIKIIFLDAIGYYWIFPREPDKKEVNVGLGVIGKKKPNLKKMLEEFKVQKKIDGEINFEIGGQIPVGLQRPLLYKNILFVGDTGVGTFPLNGEGIYRALISGEIAGKCIATGKVKKYPSIIKKRFIKWDILGKSFLLTGDFIKIMGTKTFLNPLNYFYKIFYLPAIFYYKKAKKNDD